MSGPTRNLRIIDEPLGVSYHKVVRVLETEGDVDKTVPVPARTAVKVRLFHLSAFDDSGTATITVGDDDDADRFFATEDVKTATGTPNDGSVERFYEDENNIQIVTDLQNGNGDAGEVWVSLEFQRYSLYDVID